MEIENCFVSPIALTRLESIDNELIKQYAYDLKSKSVGREKSNYNGWQSNDIDFANTHPEIVKLADTIMSHVGTLHKEFRLRIPAKINIMNMWINVNSTGSFNRPHVHQGSVFSGVYYVSTSGIDGKIVFHHPAITHQYHLTDKHVDEFNSFTSAVYKIDPEIGKLAIFPSWLEHYVEPNTTSQDRISISFNTNFNTEQ